MIDICISYHFIFMNKKQPTQLRQRTDYLRQKIDYLYSQVKYSDNFELKMKFVEFIDSSIERVNHIEDKKTFTSQSVSKLYQEHHKALQNSSQKKRLQKEKQELSQKERELDQREKQMEFEALKLELQNCEIVKGKIIKQANAKESELLHRIADHQQKFKAQERQIERLGQLNLLQNKEIQSLKEERNKAEKRELMWKEKYEDQVGDPEKPKKGKTKIISHSQQGLRILKTVTNVAAEKKGSERYYFCELPLRFHVVKIVYGIKVGATKNGEQIEYFQEVSLYEKEDMEMFREGGELMLLYIKRKVKLKLKYKLQQNQVFIMLFGRGDSVAIDQPR